MADHISSEELNIYAERRGKPRVNVFLPATMRGHLPGGEKFQSKAVLANMSASGMYLRTKSAVSTGDEILVVVRLSSATDKGKNAPRLAASGKVVRVEQKIDGTQGVALKLQHHRFI